MTTHMTHCSYGHCPHRPDPDSENPGRCRRHGALPRLPPDYSYVSERTVTVAQIHAAGGTPRWVINTLDPPRGARVPPIHLAVERKVAYLLVLAHAVSETVKVRKIDVIHHLHAHQDCLTIALDPVNYVLSAILVLAAAMGRKLEMKEHRMVRALPGGFYEVFMDRDGFLGWHRITCEVAQALDTECRLCRVDCQDTAAYEVAAWHVENCLGCGGHPPPVRGWRPPMEALPFVMEA